MSDAQAYSPPHGGYLGAAVVLNVGDAVPLCPDCGVPFSSLETEEVKCATRNGMVYMPFFAWAHCDQCACRFIFRPDGVDDE